MPDLRSTRAGPHRQGVRGHPEDHADVRARQPKGHQAKGQHLKTIRKPRHTFTLEALVRQLRQDVPGFKAESVAVQTALAELVWIGDAKRRQHTVHDGYMSFHHTELAVSFGRQFNAINARLGFLDVKRTKSGADSYRWITDGDDDGNATDGFTRAFRFMPTVQASRVKWLAKRITTRTPLSRLLDANGSAFRTPPRAISSQDSQGATTTRWQAINQAGSLSLVPVNIASLKQFGEHIGNHAEIWRRTGRAPQDLFMEVPSLAACMELQEMTAKILRMAHTDVGGMGNVVHLYQESASGRLFALNTANLCGVPREFRKAALAGMWDYDVKNCHFAIIAQMARRLGYPCAAIEHYLNNTKPVRHEIADAVGISYEDTKTSLLSVMYGAKSEAWYWYKCAIPAAIGKDAARRLHELPLFANIAADVKLAREVILAHAKPNRQGGLVNAFGKSMKVKGTTLNAYGKLVKVKKTPEQCLAHLLQGVEALALEACTKLYPQDIILLQHDGFTATKPLDVKALEQAVETATGYVLELEEEPVVPDLAAQYAKTVKNEFSKVRNSKNSNAGAKLGYVHGSPMTAKSARCP